MANPPLTVHVVCTRSLVHSIFFFAIGRVYSINQFEIKSMALKVWGTKILTNFRMIFINYLTDAFYILC